MVVLKTAPDKVPSRPTVARCRLCEQQIVSQALSIGSLPVCNRFSLAPEESFRANLDVVECENCRLIQLRQVAPVEELVPRLPWIRYREPESHLNALIDAVLTLRPDARTLLGAGPFEQPLIHLASERGMSTTTLTIEASRVKDRYPYLESWQASLNERRLSEALAHAGPFDIVSCRYIVEHSPTPVAALRALKQMISPHGLLLIEVPDSSKFLEAKDYCFLWEEHCCYFVEDTLRQLGETAGYRVHAILRYPGLLEDALVAVLEPAEASGAAQSRLGSSNLFMSYRDDFVPTREMLRVKLSLAAGAHQERLALFGIGHHAVMFVNMFGLAPNIALAVDDDKDKAGFFPPGFSVPVVNSAELLANRNIKTCLFAVSPNAMPKLQEKLAPLIHRGVEFRSIYAAIPCYPGKASGP